MLDDVTVTRWLRQHAEGVELWWNGLTRQSRKHGRNMVQGVARACRDAGVGGPRRFGWGWYLEQQRRPELAAGSGLWTQLHPGARALPVDAIQVADEDLANGGIEFRLTR